MRAFLLRRTLAVVPVLVVGSIAVWSLLYIAPGDPARIRLGPDATELQVELERQELGLDGSPIEQYARWAGRALGGDLGYSFTSVGAVSDSITDRLPVTLSLTLIGLGVSLLLGVPLGLLAATSRRWRGVARAYSTIALAAPSFWIGILLVNLFAVRWGILPATGYRGPTESWSEYLSHLVLPVATLSIYGAGIVSRFVMAAALDVVDSEFVVAAQSRGVSPRLIMRRYLLRNTLVQVLTAVGLQLGLLLGGAVVLESVYNLPGVGTLLFTAVQRRDFPVIQGVALFSLLSFMVINFVVDLTYALIDPRVRLRGSSA